MIKLEHIRKKYGKEIVFDDFNLEIENNEFVAIMGKSGKGKTTLLNILSGVINIEEGRYILNNIEVNKLSKAEKRQLRSSKIGYIIQNYGLLNELTVEKNIRICDSLFKKKPSFDFESIINALEIDGLLYKKPLEISGGQRQRVAIARAIYNKPQVLLLDEPTGNLDSDTAKRVMELIKKIHTEGKLTIVLVTHDEQMAHYADRIINL